MCEKFILKYERQFHMVQSASFSIVALGKMEMKDIIKVGDAKNIVDNRKGAEIDSSSFLALKNISCWGTESRPRNIRSKTKKGRKERMPTR